MNDLAVSSSDATRSHLLELPAELRLQIYEDLIQLVTPFQAILAFVDPRGLLAVSHKTCTNCYGLLISCKQIYVEFEPLVTQQLHGKIEFHATEPQTGVGRRSRPNNWLYRCSAPPSTYEYPGMANHLALSSCTFLGRAAKLCITLNAESKPERRRIAAYARLVGDLVHAINRDRRNDLGQEKITVRVPRFYTLGEIEALLQPMTMVRGHQNLNLRVVGRRDYKKPERALDIEEMKQKLCGIFETVEIEERD